MSKVTCKHILTRGPRRGLTCLLNPLDDNEYCHHHKHNEIEPCSICLEQIKDTNHCTLDCGHKFHLPCIFELYKQFTSKFNNKCPLCRKEFTEKVVPINQTTHIYMRNDENDEDIQLLSLNNNLQINQAVSPAVSPHPHPILNLENLPPPAPLRRQRAIPINSLGEEMPSFHFINAIVELVDNIRS